MEIFEAIKNRRSIRKYRPDPVDDKTLETILEAGRWAPSWANTQCWRFIVVRDSNLRTKIAETLIGVSGKAGQSLQIPPHGDVIAPNKGISERPNRAAEAIEAAPVTIVACAELGKSGFKKGEAATDKGDWFMFDVALALQNLTLAAYARGLGTVHVGLFDAKKAGKVIGTPKGVAVVEIVPVGYPEVVPPAPARKEVSEFVFHEKYG